MTPLLEEVYGAVATANSVLALAKLKPTATNVCDANMALLNLKLKIEAYFEAQGKKAP